ETYFRVTRRKARRPIWPLTIPAPSRQRMLAIARLRRARHSSGDEPPRALHKRSRCPRAQPSSTIRRPAATTFPSARAPSQSGPAKKESYNPAQEHAVSEKIAGLAQPHSRGVAELTSCTGRSHATSWSAQQLRKGCGVVVRR